MPQASAAQPIQYPRPVEFRGIKTPSDQQGVIKYGGTSSTSASGLGASAIGGAQVQFGMWELILPLRYPDNIQRQVVNTGNLRNPRPKCKAVVRGSSPRTHGQAHGHLDSVQTSHRANNKATQDMEKYRRRVRRGWEPEPRSSLRE